MYILCAATFLITVQSIIIWTINCCIYITEHQIHLFNVLQTSILQLIATCPYFFCPWSLVVPIVVHGYIRNITYLYFLLIPILMQRSINVLFAKNGNHSDKTCITQYGSTGWHWFSSIKCVHKEIVIFTFNVHLFGLLAASL